ncbi:MAG: pilus assembly protein [Bryobacterales bacterium]|nr:pilus assembly protein [Bryobacterales bacterium]
MRKPTSTPSPRRRGHAVVEVALMAPWVFLLFIAVFNFGFYAYAAIATANAARVAALYAASAPSTSNDVIGACSQAVDEMRALPNVGLGVAVPCNSCSGNTCTAGPIQVRLDTYVGAGCADNDPSLPTPVTRCAQVAVTYQSIQLFPLPWMMGRMNLTRIVQARVKPE